MNASFLTHPLLGARDIAHGFGLRQSPPLPGVHRPRQVHGTRVAVLDTPPRDLGEADAVVSTASGEPVAVVTADCVPVLLASADGRAVAAVHAGWKGLGSGVVAAALRVLGEHDAGRESLLAVIGPHIGGCCYEVDAPVLEPLRERFGAALDDASRCSRPGHARVDLGALARLELTRCGVAPEAIGAFPETCTRCDARRFHSFRRDGERSGRLLHWIACASVRPKSVRGPESGVDTPGSPP